ncbi:MAG: redoxin domain-containing protein [Patescibacteria group bacterium]|nr:cytochrome c biogenesis protein/redoxin [Patescibacteria group bacterium]MDE1945585.1 redoxin domain-containing protein [Patescibacteria group bacterium]
MLLLFISFAAGVLTVLAPCTIALLPVIVGGTVSGERSFRRTATVTVALGASVIAFTLLLKVSTAFISVPQAFWNILSGAIIAVIGVAMIFPNIWEKLPFMNIVSRRSNALVAKGYGEQNVWGDILVGVSLGPVFSSCSPTYFLILAAVLPKNFLEGLGYLLAYTVGLALTLFVVSIAGQKLLDKLGVAANPEGWLKKTIGVVFLLLGLTIAFGFEARLELALTNAGYFDVTGIEQTLLQRSPLASAPAVPAATSTALSASSTVGLSKNDLARITMEMMEYQKAPEIADPSGFIDTGGAPITIGQFKGRKVVLIDFWTYSCINCQREIPYLKAWWQKYMGEGLEIISIHTPEFSFEKVQSNVEAAVKAAGITYPVVMDNDYGTWNAFGNEYWPRLYIVNTDGFIVYDHIGEGDYDKTEAAIQAALAERNTILSATGTVARGTVAPAGAIGMNPSEVASQETYFGSNRNEFLANGSQNTPGMQTLSIPASVEPSALYLGGAWNFSPEYAAAATGSEIEYEYQAKNMYFVAASENSAGTKIKITVDGHAPGALAGADVAPDGTATITSDRLYDLISGSDYGTHTIVIQILSGVLDAYTFTFG